MLISILSGVLFVVLSFGIIFLGTNGLLGIPLALILALAVTGLIAFVDLKIKKKNEISISKGTFIFEYILNWNFLAQHIQHYEYIVF